MYCFIIKRRKTGPKIFHFHARDIRLNPSKPSDITRPFHTIFDTNSRAMLLVCYEFNIDLHKKHRFS